MGSHTVNGASNGLGSTEDLLHDSGQLLGLGPGPHDSGGADDVVHGDVAVVLDVLDLLAVAWRLLQGLDDQGGGGGHNVDLGLTVLDGQLDGDLQTFPVLGGLGDVVTDLLGRQTQGTDLGSEGGGGGDLTSHSSQAHDLDFIGIELGWHDGFLGCWAEVWRRKVLLVVDEICLHSTTKGCTRCTNLFSVQGKNQKGVA